MSQSLFLHYGPGGNSFCESQAFNKILTETIFWNQPSVKHEKNSFSKLVELTEKQIKQSEASPLTLIGHSFGCDLIAALNKKQSLREQSLILVSPILNIPQGMLNLAKKLSNTKPSEELNKIYEIASYQKSNMNSEVFWLLVNQIVQHTNYANVFWSNYDKKFDYDSTAAKGPAFDAIEWQTVMQDYLFNYLKQSPADHFHLLEGKKVKVIIGENDPYFDKSHDLPIYENIFGKQNIVLIKQAGHFVHLEKSSDFLKLLKL